jgi:ankyrin repeat protein
MMAKRIEHEYVNNDPIFEFLSNIFSADELREYIKAGANVNAVDDDGMTPIMWVAHWDQDPECLQVLLDAGADINARDFGGFTALRFAEKGINNREATMDFLIKNGATF